MVAQRRQPLRAAPRPAAAAAAEPTLTATSTWTRADLRQGFLDTWRHARPGFRKWESWAWRVVAVLMALAAVGSIAEGDVGTLVSYLVLLAIALPLAVDRLAAELRVWFCGRSRTFDARITVGVDDAGVRCWQEGQVHGYPWSQVQVVDTGRALTFVLQKGLSGHIRQPFRDMDPALAGRWRAFVAGRAPVTTGAPAPLRPGGPPSPSG